MKKIIIGILLFLFFILLLILNSAKQFFPEKQLKSSGKNLNVSEQKKEPPLVEIYAQNLRVPWDMVFLPDKSMLVTEREGKVLYFSPEGKQTDEPALVLEKVKEMGESGLQGMALHPDFAMNHFVYLYYTYAEPSQNTLNRVSRFTYQNKKLIDEKIIIDAIPGAPNHDGGRIRFGPDNLLYITTGDAQKPSQSQDKDSLAGKILRADDLGKAVSDNPFHNLVYSYGHRNPQGLAWNDKGQLFATEHGRSGVLSGLDELNKITKGGNYGWPVIQGDETKAGMITPLINSGPDVTWAPSGMAFWDGSFYFAGLRGQTLYKATIKDNKAILKEYFVKEYGRLRNVIVGPDQFLYVSTSNRDGRGIPQKNDDKILKINPKRL